MIRGRDVQRIEPGRYVAVKLSDPQQLPGPTWERLWNEAMQRLGHPKTYTVWVDLPTGPYGYPQSWNPQHRFVVVNFSRRPR
jgi:hypothetical protein